MSGHSSSKMDAMYRMSLADVLKKGMKRLAEDVDGTIAMAATWTMATATHAKSPSYLAFNQAERAMHVFAYSPLYSRTPSFATIFPPLTT